MKKTKIIIIVPCYNVEKYIRECIESLLNQTKEDFIIICVDDKSTDKTLDVLKEIKKEFTTGQKIKEDSFLILENKVNKKVSRTINETYDYIKNNFDYEYMYRMDSDDALEKNAIQKQYDFLERNKDIDICGIGFEYFGAWSGGKIFPETNFKINLTKYFNWPISQGGCMIRKNVVDAYRYDVGLDFAEDGDYFLRVLKKHKAHNLPEKLFRYRIHESQKSRQGNLKQRVTGTKIAIKYAPKILLPIIVLYNLAKGVIRLIQGKI
jgi:glycosyltransferase involved in cell wall biosynthesis